MGELTRHLDTASEVGRVFLDRLRSHAAYGGLDLASTGDLTSFVLAWPVKEWVYIYPWFWIPADGLTERSRHDGVRYDLWLQQGLIETTPGSVTDWRFVTERIKQLSRIFKIKRIGFDRYGARDTVADLSEMGFEVADIGQGYVSMSPPSKRLEELVLAKRIVHNGHAVLRWNIDCCSIVSDAAGNIKPEKPERGRSSKRIDGVVAMIMALDCVMRAEKKGRSIYSTRGLLVA